MSKRKPLPKSITKSSKQSSVMDGLITGQPSPTPPDNTAPPTSSQEKTPEKTRVNHYISTDVLDELDAVWLKLRKLSGKRRVSKSQIVETALRMALSDFTQRGQDSVLTQELT